MYINWDLIFSLVTAVIAIVAIGQTHSQIKISNKQHLFDERVKNYLFFDGLVQLYIRNKSLIETIKKDEMVGAVDLEFLFMTNNSYLSQISSAIKEPLTEPYHHELLIKLEEIKNISTKIKLLFTDSVIASDFILHYQELLFSMYQYKILLNNMQKASNDYIWSDERCQKEMGEENQRKELLASFATLKNTYMEMEEREIREKLEKQIKL